MKPECCAVCEGSGLYYQHHCTFCNGSGEWNNTAEKLFKNHICQCLSLDRKNCPVCKKPCHHDTTNRPKVLISPI